MSLLMDALKRAEATKAEPPAEPGKSAFPSNGPELALEDTAPATAPRAPLHDATDAPTRLADFDAALEAADEELGLEGSGVDLSAPVPGDVPLDANAQRDAANTLFTAKTGSPGAMRRRAPFFAVIGTLIVVGAGTAYYFWSELDKLTQSGSGLVARSGSIRAPLPAPPPPATPIAPTPVTTATTDALPAAPTAPPAAEPVPPAERRSPSAAEPVPAAVATADASTTGPVFRRKAAGASNLPTAAPTPTVRAGTVAPVTATPAQLAHAAMLQGDRESAERYYRNMVASDPRNVDALVGLASLALDRRDAAAAEHFYLSALEADPKSATAQAGLINLHGQRDPSFAESRLKVLLGNLTPGSPAAAGVVFVLGNHYARQSRWNEAQRAYFEAYSLEPANPDYQFNLAVALEHLQKGPLALNFYRGALSAAAQRAASFDRQQAKDRIDALDAAAR